jgi:Flp pilus assembly protein TadG
MNIPSKLRNGGRRGNATLEFALSFGLLSILISGIFQLGHSLYIYNQITVAVANAARYAGRDGIQSPDSAYQTRVKNVVVYGNPEGTGTPQVTGMSTSNVSVTIQRDAEDVPQTFTVAVTTFAINGVFGTITLSGKPFSTVRYAGRYQPYA